MILTGRLQGFPAVASSPALPTPAPPGSLRHRPSELNGPASGDTNIPGTGPDRSQIRAYGAAGHSVVELRGEIDIATAVEIAPILDTVTEAGRLRVIVDLLQDSFLDCFGLRLLCRARSRVGERGGSSCWCARIL